MDKLPIIQLENQLEQLIEGVFANLFHRRLSGRDIALQLVRSMEDNLKAPLGNDPRIIAPDDYRIHLNPDVRTRFEQTYPDIQQTLGEYLVTLATQAQYCLLNNPKVKLKANPTLTSSQCLVEALHTSEIQHTTAAMQPIQVSDTKPAPKNPQIVINGERTIQLKKKTINIGRSDNNDIILDDPRISRYHLQLRLRFGSYTLFDIQSTTGTTVNNVAVREYRLQSGDVIRIGQTQIIYTEDSPPSAKTTGTLDPVSL